MGAIASCCLKRDDAGDSSGLLVGDRHVEGEIDQFYHVGKEHIGSGAFAFVAIATEKISGARRAVKVINKHQSEMEALKLEVGIMSQLHHPHIVKLYETFIDPVYLYLVMEPCDGGELFAKVIELKRFSEKNCAMLMHQLLYAINYMHKANYCHRDLKPENVLLKAHVNDIADAEIKVADLGFAHQFSKGVPLRSKCGTPLFVAPEVIQDLAAESPEDKKDAGYTELCDLWSCGVLMYLLLCGHHPFTGRTKKSLFIAVVKGNVQFDQTANRKKCWDNIGDECKDLVRGLLEKDPTKRINAADALQHKWIRHQAPGRDDVHVHEDLIFHMQRFHQENKLKQLVTHNIAHQMDQSSIEEIRETFEALDTDEDGHLTLEEFKKWITQSSLNVPLDLQSLLEEIDPDHDGLVDYEDFISVTLDRRVQVRTQACWAAFNKFDTDKDGKVHAAEFVKALSEEDSANPGSQMTAEETKAMLADLGINKDAVDFKEFLDVMCDKDGSESARNFLASLRMKSPNGAEKAHA